MTCNSSGTAQPDKDIIEYLEKVHDAIEVILPLLRDNNPCCDFSALRAINPTTDKEIPNWMTLDDVCENFKLARNNIKSRTWRIKHSFPFHQASGPYSAVIYNKEEVEEWLLNRFNL